MPKEVRAYKCRWCNAVMLDAEQAIEAEKICRRLMTCIM